ncbi:hypothetical protein K461DRAFT_301637 [Myriangium duriaei CBS 260.36]|uniref:Uncharacterized protein n=1 Tax=Myriangium duriaei CBS 260.36 TaxID=1168546 RepID=A0A9P4IYA8_9PEZI|nr:hypothetical protein K461DRAFT_301637 [Myriangium duriaei CBS 260.36]
MRSCLMFCTTTTFGARSLYDISTCWRRTFMFRDAFFGCVTQKVRRNGKSWLIIYEISNTSPSLFLRFTVWAQTLLRIHSLPLSRPWWASSPAYSPSVDWLYYLQVPQHSRRTNRLTLSAYRLSAIAVSILSRPEWRPSHHHFGRLAPPYPPRPHASQLRLSPSGSSCQTDLMQLMNGKVRTSQCIPDRCGSLCCGWASPRSVRLRCGLLQCRTAPLGSSPSSGVMNAELRFALRVKAATTRLLTLYSKYNTQEPSKGVFWGADRSAQ